MTPPLTALQREDPTVVIHLYEEDRLSTTALAKLYGVSAAHAYNVLVWLGARIRSRREAAFTLKLDVDELVRRYEAGESGAALAAEKGVDWSTIYDRLHAAGVKIRSQSEVKRRMWADPVSRAKLEAKIPGKYTKAVRQKFRAAALRRQWPTRATRPELAVGYTLSSIGCEAVFQYAFDNHFVLDFAIPEQRIAIEVRGCYFHRCLNCMAEKPETSTQRHNRRHWAIKRATLQRRGWTLVEVWEHEVLDPCVLALRLYEACCDPAASLLAA